MKEWRGGEREERFLECVVLMRKQRRSAEMVREMKSVMILILVLLKSEFVIIIPLESINGGILLE